jgi:hypothetical protein
MIMFVNVQRRRRKKRKKEKKVGKKQRKNQKIETTKQTRERRTTWVSKTACDWLSFYCHNNRKTNCTEPAHPSEGKRSEVRGGAGRGSKAKDGR